MEKELFSSLIDHLLSAEFSNFFLSVPIKNYSMLDDFPKLVFMTSGEIDCDVGREGKICKVHLPSNSILFGMKGASTGCSADNQFSGCAFTIGFFPEYIRFVNYRFEDGKTADFSFLHTMKPLNASGMMALESLRSIAAASELREAKFYLIKAIVEIVKHQFFENPPQKVGKAVMTWQKVEYYIQKNQNSEFLSRATIAEKFRMNECYLSALCRQNTGRTLNDFIIRKKMEYALLLLEQNMTIGEIAQECGFCQTGYFIQVFRKIYGVSPGKYRTNNWQQNK